jgi:transposase
VLAHPFEGWKEIQERLQGIPKSRIQKVAYAHGIHRNIALKKPFISQKNVARRLQWAQENTAEDWRWILFTDECSMEVGATYRQQRVSRRPGERFDPKKVANNTVSTRQTLMVWAGIAYNFKTPLIRLPLKPSQVIQGKTRIRGEGLNGSRYAEMVIKGPLREALMVLNERGYAHEIVEDNAPAHTSLVARQAKKELGIVSKMHPPSSPDLNPLENVWSILKNKVNRIMPRPTNADDLFEVARVCWEQINHEVVNGVVLSMEKRVCQVSENKGKALRY